MSLDSIINVTISRETSVPTRKGFGAGAFVSADAVFSGFYKVYSDNNEVVSDTLAGADTIKAASLYFGQEVRPTKLYVLKKGQDLPHIQTITFDSDFVTGNSISIDIDGNTVVVPFNTNSNTTLADLATAIAAEAGVTSATDDVTAKSVTFTGASINTEVVVANLGVTGGASQPTGTLSLVQYFDELLDYPASVTRAQNIAGGDDWYGLGIASKAKADQVAMAAAIRPQVKLFAYSTDAAEVLDPADSTDIGSTLKASSEDRSIGLYSGDAATTHPEMALLGGQLPKDPGSITWAYKTLVGVTVDSLTSTQKTAVLAKNLMTYTTVAGLNITEDGKVASGEWIDVIRGSDFIQVRMKEEIFTVLVNADKIPYTEKGIAQVETAMRAVLQTATTTNGILAEDPVFTITTPKVSEISTVDKGNRLLPNVKFEGTLAGAIQKVAIAGTLVL